MIAGGAPATPFLHHGDHVAMQALAPGGSPFGAIGQKVAVTG
jgi:hypothetical protein